MSPPTTTALRLGVVFLALIPFLAQPASAQGGGSSRIEGRVFDSTHARPLAGTRVVAVGMGEQSSVSAAARSDSGGRYHIDSLPAGRYAVGFESRLLDSLEIALSPRVAVVPPSGIATIDLALPPAAKLRAAVCPGITLPSGTGAIVGHVVSAESESSLPGVTVAMSWRELGFDKATLRPVNEERAASVVTDDGGWYRACGVPTGAWLSMQLQHGDRAGPVIRTRVEDTLGLAVRHISFSATAARADTDTTSGSPEDPDGPPLSGTAKLTGIVLGPSGAPLSQADVRIRGTAASARSDAQGTYSLAALPAGTQMLQARRVGYAVVETSVELRDGVTTTQNVSLERIVNLDSVRVVAMRDRYPQFSWNKKFILEGSALDYEAIQKQRAIFTSEIIGRIPGFTIVGAGSQAKVIDQRIYAAHTGFCATNIVVDGALGFEINDVVPTEIGAIEAHRASPFTPPEYSKGGCGVIMIWTKR